MSTTEIMNEKNKGKWLAGFNLLIVATASYSIYRLSQYIVGWWQPQVPEMTMSAILFAIGALTALATYFLVLRRQDLSTYLDEAYNELTHIIFPEQAMTIRLSITILIFIVVLGFVFFLVDGLSARILFWLASL